jgi:hypothetical protein
LAAGEQNRKSLAGNPTGLLYQLLYTDPQAAHEMRSIDLVNTASKSAGSLGE